MLSLTSHAALDEELGFRALNERIGRTADDSAV